MKFIKNFDIFKLFKTMFRLTLVFLLTLVWSQYIFKAKLTSILVALFATIIIEIVLKIIYSKKDNKKNRTKEEINEIESYSMSFLFSDDKTNLEFFQRLFLKEGTLLKKSKYLIGKLHDKSTIIYPFFSFVPFSPDDLIFCINQTKKEKPDKVIILTNEISPLSEKFTDKITSCKVVLLNKSDIYFKLLKTYDCYPEKSALISSENKLNLKEFITLAIDKKRTKGYFFCSIILLLSSFIVRQNLYYIIMSSILLTLSLVSFSINDFKNEKKTGLFD